MTGSAQGSRVSVGYIAETVFNTTPATPVLKQFRKTGLTLALAASTVESAEMRATRDYADVRQGSRSVAGDIEAELVYADNDDFLQALLGGAWTTEAAGTPNTLANGVTRRSMTIEVAHLDIGRYKTYTGCTVDKLQLTAKPDAFVTTKWSILGTDMDLNNASVSGSAYTAPSTNENMDGIKNAVISLNGAPIAYVSGIDITYDNQGKGDAVLGSNLYTDIVQGRLKVTGTITAYFVDSVAYDLFLNETECDFSFELAGLPADKTLTFDHPRIKFTGVKTDIKTEQSLTLDMPFMALADPESGSTVIITRSNPA